MKFFRNLIFFIIFFVVATTLIINTLLVYINIEYVQVLFVNDRNQKIEIGSLFYRFPLGVTLEDVSVNNKFKAKKVLVNFDFIKLFSKKIGVSSCVVLEPVIHLSKNKNIAGYIFKNLPKTFREDTNIASNQDKKNYIINYQRSDLAIKVKNFRVINGELEYFSNDLHMSFKDVDLLASDILFPFENSDIQYNLSAVMQVSDQLFFNVYVKSKGLINLEKKNMDVSLKISSVEDDMRINGKILSINNNLKVDADFKSTNKFFDQINGKQDSLPVGIFATLISSVPDEINAKFSFDTKMDDFSVEKVKFEGNFVSQ